MENITSPTLSAPVNYSMPPASKLFGQSITFYKAHWRTILGIASVPVILSLPQNILSGEKYPGLVIISFLLAALAGFFARLALFDAVVEGGEPQGGVVGAYRKGLRVLVPFLWISGLVTLAALGGFFLLVIPGILLSLALSFSIYAFFVEGKRGLSALAASWHYVKGYWWRVLGKFFYFGLILLLASFALLVITMVPLFFTGGITSFQNLETSPVASLINTLFNQFVAVPLGIIYAFLIYRALREIKSAAPAEVEEAKLKKATLIFTIIGIIGLLILLFIGAALLVKFLPQFLQEFTPQINPAPASPQNLSAAIFSFAGFAPLLEFISFGQ